jgi:hypothetical protein
MSGALLEVYICNQHVTINKTTRATSKGDCHIRDKILDTLHRLKLANILHSKGRF